MYCLSVVCLALVHPPRLEASISFAAGASLSRVPPGTPIRVAGRDGKSYPAKKPATQRLPEIKALANEGHTATHPPVLPSRAERRREDRGDMAPARSSLGAFSMATRGYEIPHPLLTAVS